MNLDLFDDVLRRIIAEASRLDIASAEPGRFEDLALVSLGYKSMPIVHGPVDIPNGRAAVIEAIKDGTATAKGVPTHWCLTGMGRVLACGAIENAQARQVFPGVMFTLPSVLVRMRAISG